MTDETDETETVLEVKAEGRITLHLPMEYGDAVNERIQHLALTSVDGDIDVRHLDIRLAEVYPIERY